MTDDADARQRLARYMIRCPFALEKMRYDARSGTVIYGRSAQFTCKFGTCCPGRTQ